MIVNFYFSYITRYNVKDSSRHIILGTQQFKPSEFGAQVNFESSYLHDFYYIQ
jgi:hypothetical protein